MASSKSNQQPLLTPTSVALSLSPPRVPPHGSILRKLYTNPKAAHRHFYFSHHSGDLHHGNSEGQHDDDYQSHSLASRLLQILPHGIHIPHPHLPNSLSIPDTLTRFLGAILPLETQHSFRDGGGFKRVADSMVKLTCPLVAIGHAKEACEFLELTFAPAATASDQEEGAIASNTNTGSISDDRSAASNDINNEKSTDELGGKERRRGKWTRNRIPYGDHAMQYIDLFLPSRNNKHNKANNKNKNQDNRIPVRGTVFFVHGGAWGSGQPWMYRLVAPVFLKLNFAVVIVGYRTYPEAQTMDDQCGDVKLAWDKCEGILNELTVPISNVTEDGKDERWVGNVVMGHSSGAHVAMLMLVYMIRDHMKDFSAFGTSPHLVENNKYPWIPHYIVGLSGPYDISYHFDYEAGRGVEQISPMKPICGHSRDNFHEASPAKHLLTLFGEQNEKAIATSPTIQHLTPPILLVHGVEDSTVPFTATSDAARMLRSCGIKQCDEIYLEKTGHQDVIMHFMLGGRAKDLVMEWLTNCSKQQEMSQLSLQSRL